MSDAFTCWTHAAVRRSTQGTFLRPSGDPYEAPADVEAPRLALELKAARPNEPPPPPTTWRNRMRKSLLPALCGVAGAATYAGLVFAFYQHRIAHARARPYQLDDTEQARNWACMLGGLVPCAGAAGVALGAYMRGDIPPKVKPIKHARA